ncbi:MAG: YnbE family lipoprotein [Desulfobacterales bacterium]|nr:YnbE family lipoprotein [Desulfobacterales bacterium]
MKKLVKIILILFLFMPLGCTKHTVETKSQVELAPVEIKPIHITIDINIKVDRALDDFFSDIDESAQEIK